MVLVAVSSRYILRISDYHFSRCFKPFCFNAIKTIVLQISRTSNIHCLKYHTSQHVCINEGKYVSYYFENCNFKHYAPSFRVILFEMLAALSKVSSLIVCLPLMKSHMQSQNTVCLSREVSLCEHVCRHSASHSGNASWPVTQIRQGHNHPHVMWITIWGAFFRMTSLPI